MNPLISNLIKIRDRRSAVDKFTTAISKITNNSVVSTRITGKTFINTLC